MALVDALLSRRSIRQFEPKAIPQTELDIILEAGQKAPSALNKQPWHFIVVTDDEIKHELSKGLFSRFIKHAPITIVGCAHKDRIAGRWAKTSTTIALQNMVIAAWAMGIGSCWIGAFNEDKVRKLLNIPTNWEVVALIPFGYPSKIPAPKRKKPLDKITSYNTFS
jgi:nitroreductase